VCVLFWQLSLHDKQIPTLGIRIHYFNACVCVCKAIQHLSNIAKKKKKKPAYKNKPLKVLLYMASAEQQSNQGHRQRACTVRNTKVCRHAQERNLGSSVSIVTRLRAGRRGFGCRQLRDFFFSSPPHPEWVWGPPRLLSNGYRRNFP
jgi:hypothetical protein